MKLSFHGAAQDVTGSCHLIEVGKTKILIDCGMYQGSGSLTKENLKPFGFKPKDINYLLLTHAHLDHCGRIPILVKQGFRGEIISTNVTKELAKLVLLDSAKIHEEDYRRHSKSFKRHKKSKNEKYEILYNTLDALRAMDYFGRNVQYNKEIKLDKNIRVTFIDAGHILGSASVVLEIYEGSSSKKILFSGDIGNNNKPIVNDPTPPPAVDYVVMETTYGDRKHKPIKESVIELYDAINNTFKRGGNVYIPTFALERAQELLFFLRDGIEKNKLPKNMQVFLDSPMAIYAVEIYRNHPEYYDEESSYISKSKDPLKLKNLIFTKDVSDSISINNVKSNAIIMAGSGMCTGGRICQHLKHNIWREDCSVIFVNFAPKGTLAEKIINGAKSIYLYGEQIDINAKIYTINGFSAHAGQDELLEWHRNTGKPKMTFLVHGSRESMATFGSKLKSNGYKVKLPQLHESFEL